MVKNMKEIFCRMPSRLVAIFLCCCAVLNSLNQSDTSLQQPLPLGESGEEKDLSVSDDDNSELLDQEENFSSKNVLPVEKNSAVNKVQADFSIDNNVNSDVLNWEKYFSSVVTNFLESGVTAVESDLKGFAGLQDPNYLGYVFKIMRHFSLQDAYIQNAYSSNSTDQLNNISKYSFFSKLILLGNNLVYLSDSDTSAIKSSLQKWLSFSDENSGNVVAKNLSTIEESANKFLARSFFNPAPMDFSSSVRRSFEWCDTLLSRISLIDDFKKTKDKQKLANDSTAMVNVSDFAIKCVLLAIFERFFMLSAKYSKNISALSSEDLSDFLGGLFASLNQAFFLVNSDAKDIVVSVSKNTVESLDYILARCWYGYEYSVDVERKLTDSPLASQMVSVRNFLQILASQVVKAKKDVLGISGISKEERLFRYSPLYSFIPDADKVYSNSPSLDWFLSLLVEKQLINSEEKIKLLSSASK